MALVKALHTIHHTINETKQVQKAGDVFLVDDANLAHLVGAGAIAAPTEDEVKLYHLANPAPEPEADPKSDSDPIKGGRRRSAEDQIG